MKTRKKEELLFEKSTLEDVIKRFGNLSPANCGAGNLGNEIFYEICDKLKVYEGNLKVKDVYNLALEIKDELIKNYLLIKRSTYKK